MSEKHTRDEYGRFDDGIGTYPVSAIDFEQFKDASRALAQLEVPKLHRAGNRHEHLFIASFDGTGNDKSGDPDHKTNVAHFHDQMDTLRMEYPRVRAKYIQGPGTQAAYLARVLDGAIGHTYDRKIEEMYSWLIDQAGQWIAEDPHAQIRVMSIGFSRGAEQAAGFARLVHERGIEDAAGKHYETDIKGNTRVFYRKPPLVPPGRVLQSVALFDPVGTGIPHERDRRLPPSVVSGFQIVARDERRDQFPSSQIIPQGFSTDGRFLAVTVAGAHSDVGGGYHANGLSVLNGNLMTDFVNAHSDVTLLAKQVEPQEESLFRIHRSEEHLPIYSTSRYGQEGGRVSLGAQASPPPCRQVEACLPPEPFDPSLSDLVSTRQSVSIGESPAAPDQDLPLRIPMLVAELRAKVSPQLAIREVGSSQSVLNMDLITQTRTYLTQTSSFSPLVSGAGPAHSRDTVGDPEMPSETHATQSAMPSRAAEPDSLEARLDRMLVAADADDWDTFFRENHHFADSQAGRDLETFAKQVVDLEERHQGELQAAMSRAREEAIQQRTYEAQHQQSRGISR